MTSPTPLSKTLLKVIPISFAAGAAMELFMIYARIGSETFYDTAKRLEQERRKNRMEVAQLEQTDEKPAQHV